MLSGTSLYLLCVLSATTAIIEFTREPESQAVISGQDLILHCEAKDVPQGRALAYDWEFNGTLVNFALPKAAPFSNHSLFVPRVGPGELGIYCCRAYVQAEPEDVAFSRNATVVKAYIKPFQWSPEDVAAVEGQQVSFDCITGLSAPLAETWWVQNGVPFAGGDQTQSVYNSIQQGGAGQRSMLLVLQASQENQGSYWCVAENPLTGEIVMSETAELNVTSNYTEELPFVEETLPPSLIEAEGTALTLPCGISGKPIPKVEWLKNDLPVSLSSHITVFANGSMHISALSREDSGIYYCTGTNSVGNITSGPVLLTVAYLDVIFAQEPSDVNTTTGQFLTLPCSPPRSVPPASVVWYKGNEEVKGRSDDYAVYYLADGGLHFVNLQFSDAGRYTCVASNNHSIPEFRSSRQATVYIEGSPVIRLPPIGRIVRYNSLLNLTCITEGNPQPEVTWSWNGQPLPISSRVSLRNHGQELLIQKVNKADEGEYRCIAANSYGETRSGHALITMTVPPALMTPVRNITVNASSDANLACHIVGFPTPTVTWFKDGAVLTPSEKYHVTDHGLTIKNTSSEDTGLYRCHGSNSQGEVGSTASLVVRFPAVLREGPGNQTVAAGGMVTLQCEALGDPLPTITWHLNGQALAPSITVTHFVSGLKAGSVLHIPSVDVSHAGNYSCQASNLLGTDQAWAVLSVHVSAVITSLSPAQVLAKGQTLTLTCHVTGIPEPVVIWEFRGQQIQESSDARIQLPSEGELKILYIQPSDAGLYHCKAANVLGTAQRSVQISVYDVPKPPQLVLAMPMSVSSINVTWIPVEQRGNTPISSFIIEYKKRGLEYEVYRDDIPATDVSDEVTGLQPDTEYFFRLRAQNAAGTGGYSTVLMARTLRSAPGPPRNLQVSTVEARSITLTWEEPLGGTVYSYQVVYKRREVNGELKVEEIEHPTSPRQTYTLIDLQPDSLYQIKVRSSVVQGDLTLWGAYTSSLEVRTVQAAPSAPPSNVTAKAISPTQVQVTWNGIDVNRQNGEILGFLVLSRRSNSTEVFSQQQMLPADRETIVSHLSPWVFYEIKVVGFNKVGRSPASSVVEVRTQPTAPSGSPGDIQVHELNSTAIKVTWKGIPPNTWNSVLSGYIVQVKDMSTGVIREVKVMNPSTEEVVVWGLHPYRQYEFCVKAFTEQVENGSGPLSRAVVIITPQGIPGPVEDVKAEASVTSIKLWWQPPRKKNGVIEYYIVSCAWLGPAAASTSPSGPDGRDATALPGLLDTRRPRQKRELEGDHVPVTAAPPTTHLVVKETQVVIQQLYPSAIYRLSVEAYTAAGPGPPVYIMTTTLVIEVPETTTLAAQFTTMAIKEATTGGINKEASMVPPTETSGGQEGPLVVVIVGAVMGGLIVIAVIILLCLCLCRKKDKRPVYFIPPTVFRMQEHEISSADKQKHLKSGAGNDCSSTDFSVDPSMEGQGVKIRGTMTSQNGPHNQHMNGTWPGHGNQNAKAKSAGLDNPVYAPDGAPELQQLDAATVGQPTLRHGHVLPTDFLTQGSLSLTRKNRMRGNIAAAIAAQRNQATSVFDDTDLLISNDSVVVYHERTAL